MSKPFWSYLWLPGTLTGIASGKHGTDACQELGDDVGMIDTAWEVEVPADALTRICLLP